MMLRALTLLFLLGAAHGETSAIKTLCEFKAETVMILPGYVQHDLGNPSIVYFTDKKTHVLRQLDLDTCHVEVLAGQYQNPGFKDGVGNETKMDGPRGLCQDPVSKDLFIVDGLNYVIRRYNLNTRMMTIILGQPHVPGRQDGEGEDGRLTAGSMDITCRADGSLLLTDTNSRSIREAKCVKDCTGSPPPPHPGTSPTPPNPPAGRSPTPPSPAPAQSGGQGRCWTTGAAWMNGAAFLINASLLLIAFYTYRVRRIMSALPEIRRGFGDGDGGPQDTFQLEAGIRGLPPDLGTPRIGYKSLEGHQKVPNESVSILDDSDAPEEALFIKMDDSVSLPSPNGQGNTDTGDAKAREDMECWGL